MGCMRLRFFARDGGLAENLPDVTLDDHCPFCLKFSGLKATREAGGQFCPECGADWRTLDDDFDAPFDSVVLSSDDLPPLDLEPHHVSDGLVPSAPLLDDQTPAPLARTAELPPEATEMLAEPQRSSFGPVTVGLVFALAATVAAGVAFEALSEPEPAPRPLAARHQPAPPPPVKKAKPNKPTGPALPSSPDAPDRKEEAVEQAIQLATQHLPAAHIVKLSARIKGTVAYLDGSVDSRKTLEIAQGAAARVFGVEAVDTRGVRVVYRRHQLERGDTLSALARRYYGDPGRWMVIWKANQHLAARPDSLVAGSELLIPTEPD